MVKGSLTLREDLEILFSIVLEFLGNVNKEILDAHYEIHLSGGEIESREMRKT